VRLSLRIRELEDITVICCRGRIAYRDEADALSLRALSLLKQKRALVFDLSEVNELDGAGLGKLAGIQAQATKVETPVALCGATGLVREMLELTRLNSVFPLYSDVDQAVRHTRLRQPAPRQLSFALKAIAPSTVL
jgi:anti-sigma B factor antagonist